MTRRNLLGLLASLPFVRGEFKSAIPKKRDPWPGDPIGTIVRNYLNIVGSPLNLVNPAVIVCKSGHKWVRKFGAISYPKGSPNYGTRDYYWERVA